jgi:hypothetical protein
LGWVVVLSDCNLQVVDYKKGQGNCTADKFEQWERDLVAAVQKLDIPPNMLVAMYDNAGQPLCSHH